MPRNGVGFLMPSGQISTTRFNEVNRVSELQIIENTKKAQDEYGHMWGSGHEIITKKQIRALLAGKQLAFEDGEYAHFISMSEPL